MRSRTIRAAVWATLIISQLPSGAAAQSGPPNRPVRAPFLVERGHGSSLTRDFRAAGCLSVTLPVSRSESR